MAVPERPYPQDVIALAGLTLAQSTLRRLLDMKIMSPEDVAALINNAAAIHLQSPAGESKQNRQIGGLLREIGDDLSRQG